MTTRFSTGLRNYTLATGSVRDALAGGKIRIFSGQEPASADAAESGDLLMEITKDGNGTGITLDATAADGVIAKVPAHVFKGEVLTAGLAGYFRYVAPGDTGDISTTDRRAQGRVALAGAEMNLTSTTFAMSEERSLKQFVIALPTL